MNNRLRQLWFRHYWWITVAVFGAVIATILVFQFKDGFSLIATLVGVALTIIYFVQKQKLEEIQLFEKLFTQFNSRYQVLNEKLEDIRRDPTKPEVEVRKVLNEYFNLCAEEYLFYSEGRIHPAAWRAWCRGMLYYLDKDHIRTRFEEDCKVDSFYGLTFDIIQKGAGR